MNDIKIKRFDRHANMSSEVLSQIGIVKNQILFAKVDGKLKTDESIFNLDNMLSELYDGYLYSELKVEAKRILPDSINKLVVELYNICDEYPEII